MVKLKIVLGAATYAVPVAFEAIGGTEAVISAQGMKFTLQNMLRPEVVNAAASSHALGLDLGILLMAAGIAIGAKIYLRQDQEVQASSAKPSA
jgi:hypothetical protein